MPATGRKARFFRCQRQALLVTKHPLFPAMFQNALEGVHTAYSLQLFVKYFIEGNTNLLRHGAPGQKVKMALAGAIGFIGLVIPHMLRLCGITDHRTLLPASAVAGAATLLIADIIARLALTAAELPIGVVTATLGAPVFIWLLLKAGR